VRPMLATDMRNLPLSLKLALAVAGVVLLAVGLVAASVGLVAGASLSDYVSLRAAQQMQTLVPQLETHYANEGSWAGAEGLLLAGAPQMARGRGMGPAGMGQSETVAMMNSTRLIVTDADGLVVVDLADELLGERLGRRTLARGVALRVNGQLIGYLAPREGAAEAQFRQQVTHAIIVAGLAGALVAIALGWWLTRRALRPLTELNRAAGQIGAGDLAYRVPVSAGDEVGRLAGRFNEMAAALERNERLRQQMVNDIAHELRTPLTVMQGHLEALQDGVFALSIEALKPIYDETLLLGRLVGDLRDLARAEAGHLDLELAPLEAASLLARAQRQFRNEAEAAGVELRVDAPANLPPIEGDAQRLGQVLANLISNALRYTPRGGQVTLSARAEGRWLLVAVADTGEGIAPADLALVFERFYRADRSRTRDAGHSGLGLAIARQLIEAHGGALTAISEIGVGSVFTARLPLAG